MQYRRMHHSIVAMPSGNPSPLGDRTGGLQNADCICCLPRIEAVDHTMRLTA